MRRAYSVFLAVSFLAAATSSFSADAEHRRATLDFLRTSRVEEILNAAMDKMLEIQISQEPAIAPYKETLTRFFRKYMSFESLKEDLIDMYGEAFTTGELIEMTLFYETPTGQKALSQTPVIMGKSAELGQRRIQEHIEDLKAMISTESERIQKLQKSEKH